MHVIGNEQQHEDTMKTHLSRFTNPSTNVNAVGICLTIVVPVETPAVEGWLRSNPIGSKVELSADTRVSIKGKMDGPGDLAFQVLEELELENWAAASIEKLRPLNLGESIEDLIEQVQVTIGTFNGGRNRIREIVRALNKQLEDGVFGDAQLKSLYISDSGGLSITLSSKRLPHAEEVLYTMPDRSFTTSGFTEESIRTMLSTLYSNAVSG
jgi:hypothetical protein